VIGGDDGRERTWIDRVLPPHGGRGLVFCQHLRSRTLLNGGVRERHGGIVHGSRRGEHGSFLDVAAQIDTTIWVQHCCVERGRVHEGTLERWGYLNKLPCRD